MICLASPSSTKGMHTCPSACPVQSLPRAEVRARRQEIARVAKKNRELHSLRCDMEYKLAIARWVGGWVGDVRRAARRAGCGRGCGVRV